MGKKRKLLACETLRDEVELLLEKDDIQIDVQWMSNELHTHPENLRDALQKEIDASADMDELLFAYGNCGNGLVGLKSETSTLIIPKFGDCIDIFLWQCERLERVRTNTYFLTRGWLNGNQGLEWEIDYNIKRFGEKRARRIMDMMYKHYTQLMLIDTGAYDLNEEMPRVNRIAETIGMEPVIQKGDLTPIQKLLHGIWDEDFCIIPPGRETTYKDFEGTNLRLPC